MMTANTTSIIFYGYRHCSDVLSIVLRTNDMSRQFAIQFMFQVLVLVEALLERLFCNDPLAFITHLPTVSGLPLAIAHPVITIRDITPT